MPLPAASFGKLNPFVSLGGLPQSDLLRRAYEQWLEKRGERDMPNWAALQGPGLDAYWQSTLLFEVLHDPANAAVPLDFRYRHVGQRIRTISNDDYIGRRLSELPHQKPPSRVWDHLAAAVEARAPVRGELPYVGRNREVGRVFHIVLPLSDDGVGVNWLLVVVDFGLSGLAQKPADTAP